MSDSARRRVTVLTADKDERARAEAILSQVTDQDVHVYEGMLTAWADREAASALNESGLVTSRSDSPADTPPQLHTGAEPADTDARMGASMSAREGADEPSGEASAPTPNSYIAQFAGPIRPEWLRDLQGKGISYEARIGVNAFRLLLTPAQAEILRGFSFVTDVSAEPNRVTTSVLDEFLEARSPGGALASSALAEDPIATFDAIVHRREDVGAVRELLEKHPDVQIEAVGGDIIRFLAHKGSAVLVSIARLPTVKLLTEFKRPTLLCNVGRAAIGLDKVTSAPIARFPWTGRGVTVGVMDSGADTSHPDLTPAVVKILSRPGALAADTIGHGTHVAGIIAGRGVASSGAVRGAAPDANLVVMAMVDAASALLIPPDHTELFAPVIDEGASILNLSWGTPISAAYDHGAAQVDRIIYEEHPNALFVIAAGNSGIALEGAHRFGTVGTPASAKNAITVGAWSSACDQSGCPNTTLTWGQKRSQKFPKSPAADELVCPALPGTVAAISSRGPTDFESVKPDVVAPGVFVESTRSATISAAMFETCATHGPKYVCCTGTSMATPFVSGAAAVLTEYLRDVRGTAKPSAVLLKALLIASARRVRASSKARGEQNGQKVGFPDFDQGFGLIDLASLLPHEGGAAKRRLAFVDIANDSAEALASRQPPDGPRKSSRIYGFTVAADAVERLRVVLCWTDWPGAFLQNNLQLDVRQPDGVAVLGNQEHIFHKDVEFDDLSQDTGTPFDKRNNVEVIQIDNPSPAAYRIRVTAMNTPFPMLEPRQGYALVVSGELESDSL